MAQHDCRLSRHCDTGLRSLTGLAWTLVVALVVWHIVVTVVLLVLLRQVAVLSVVTGLRKAPQGEARLVIGGAIPVTMSRAVPELSQPGTFSYVVWLTGQCLACRTFADELLGQQGSDFTDPIVILLTGSDAGARQTVERLSGRVSNILLDPAASEVVNELGLDAYPFALEVEGGVIAGWTGVRSMNDLIVLRNARVHREASGIVRTAVGARGTAVSSAHFQPTEASKGGVK